MSGNKATHISLRVLVSFSRSRYQASASTEAITAIDPNSRCFTVVKSQGQGRNPESDRAADRHQHGGREVLPLAEFETNLRRERQLEGIAKAKGAGVYRGRKPSIDQAQVEKLKAEGLGATETAKRLNIGRASVYRVLS
jgi:hypothetical protein